MQIWLIVPPDEKKGGRETKGATSEPGFCPFVAHGAEDSATGVGVGCLTETRSSFLVHVRY